MKNLGHRTCRQLWLGFCFLALFHCVSASLWAREARAARVALVVGSNIGLGDDERLKHAEADAERMATTLTRFAGVDAEDAIVVKGQGAAAVRQGFRAASARLEKISGERVFFFYYSGHANSTALRATGTELPLAELKQLLLDLPATVRVAIVDACQSGTLTRMKGGRPGVAFDMSAASARTAGLAILSSTTDGELAQESDALQGSFFTYHLDAGLRGLADRDRNGEVTLVESFDYASERTTNTTLSTSAGPQHPSFRYDLAGQGDLVISRLWASTTCGFVVFDRPGWYFVRNANGRLVAEVRSDGSSRRLALESGTFELVGRDAHALTQGKFRVSIGKDVAVSSVPTTSVSLGRAVRKGGSGATHATTMSLGGLWRGSLVGLGPWLGGGIGVKEDLDWASFEGRVTFARAVGSTRVESQTSELSFSLVGLRALDFTFGTMAGGAQVGWGILRQRVEWLPVTTTHAATLAPLTMLEIPLGLHLAMRGEASVPLYWLRVASQSGTSEAQVAASVQLGVGVAGGF